MKESERLDRAGRHPAVVDARGRARLAQRRRGHRRGERRLAAPRAAGARGRRGGRGGGGGQLRWGRLGRLCSRGGRRSGRRKCADARQTDLKRWSGFGLWLRGGGCLAVDSGRGDGLVAARRAEGTIRLRPGRDLGRRGWQVELGYRPIGIRLDRNRGG